jgi:thiamine pyrophosphate-dependent acetolactate synthase large subunit-like protein
MATVADQIIATLKASRIQRVYGLPGDSLNGFTDAIRRAEGITWEHVRHEEAAAFAAAADAALTRNTRKRPSLPHTNSVEDAARQAVRHRTKGFG